MIRLQIFTIDDEVVGAEPQKKAPGSFEGALRLSRQRAAHRESMSCALRIHTVQELAAVEADDEEERAAAAAYDADRNARVGVSAITPYYYEDNADQFGRYDNKSIPKRRGLES